VPTLKHASPCTCRGGDAGPFNAGMGAAVTGPVGAGLGDFDQRSREVILLFFTLASHSGLGR